MQYRLILQDNTQKAYRLFTWFLFFFHLVAAGIVGMNTAGKTTLYIFSILLALAALILYFFRKQERSMDIFGTALGILCTIFWIKVAGWIAALIFVTLFLFIRMVQQRRTVVEISAAGILIKRVMGTTRYEWKQTDNLVLKDGLLTIDLLSNKMVQAELAADTEPIDENAFNLFCRQHLANKN